MFAQGIYMKLFATFFVIAGLSILSNTASFAENVHSSKVYGVAIDGYDPVAYFTENRPVKGNSEISYTYQNPSHREKIVSGLRKAELT